MKSGLAVAHYVLERLALALLCAVAAVAAIYTALCAAGLAPWLDLPLSFGGTVYPLAGAWVQGGLAALALGLCFFVPGSLRVMRLETSHRRFAVGMNDVARAYAAAHHADRQGVFRLSSEFDSVRERMAFLRDHPDLADLEPEIMEIAAQMSHVSRELAEIYSEEKVARARDFLRQRQQELAQFNDRIGQANKFATEIRQWTQQVEMEESVARAQLDRLREELREIAPELLEEPAPRPSADIVKLGPQAAE